MTKLVRENLNEETYKKTPFTSTPVKVGDVYYDCDRAKPGYENYRKVKSIEGNYAEVVIWGGFDKSYERGKPWHESLAYIQKCMDEKSKEKFDKEEFVRKLTHQFKQKSGIDNVKGGDLRSMKVQFELKKILEKFKAAAEKFKVESKSIPAGGFSGASSLTMSSMQSGIPVKLVFNNVHRGGYYEGSTPFIVQIQVGGALDYNTRKAILNVARELLQKYSYETELGKSYIRETSGTNWSAVMLSAPSSGDRYSIIPALNK